MSEPACAFCARRRDQVRWLIAGPGLCICDGCVQEAIRVVRLTGAPRAMTRTCSFCQQRTARSQYLGGHAVICDACVRLCAEVIDEVQAGAAPRAPIPTARVVRR